ncbi:hypothetical protein BC937DRAFT_91803 [Endogone sp. FLAS-F59071]|nr:hypothetical protein BC937DRAFT_91803 [Endogone sp. FLAS-F59071]|eukprot:RUS15922.1 hypothetical protein BC937DRAFT_91803 [Endogone sp. FLAS-F59071]
MSSDNRNSINITSAGERLHFGHPWVESFDDAPFDKVPFDEAPFDEAPFDEAPFDEAPFDEAPLASTAGFRP